MSTTVVATNYGEMIAAQQTLVDWAQVKLDAEKNSFNELNQVREQLQGNGLSADRVTRQLDACKRRLTYYAKVAAALRAGYTIVPSMWSTIFAVRTKSERPPRSLKDRPDKCKPPVRALDPGLGRYVGPGTEYYVHDGGPHPTREGKRLQLYKAANFLDVELPVEAQKPQIIEATARAMRELVFDAIGIVNRGSDPMILGEIKRPGAYDRTQFLICYFVDFESL